MIILAVLAFSAAAQSQAPPMDAWRLIQSDCLGCHNQKLSLGGLSLATRESVLSGGKRGPIVVPGDPSRSRLIEVLRHSGNVRMPPGRALTESQIQAFEAWIRAGVPMPASAAPAAPPKPNHWSFRTPVRPAEPEVRNPKWVRNPIDRFILARLEKESIAPSPEAPAATLIRRLHLDLTGLLPPPSASAGSPGAYERLVETLLSSPHFGEKWARRWLDQARYADSDGGSRDEPRQIWKYRDWVIDALNRDQPFNQFVIEQLAGDMLPGASPAQFTATGFHRNSPIQIEAGTDREQYRVEAVFDRVDVTGTVFLGLSVGCARCHDHKFDPITNREYYQLFAILNNTDDWSEDRPRYDPRLNNLHDVQGPLFRFASPAVERQWDETYDRIVSLDRQIAAYRKDRKPAKDDETLAGMEKEFAALKKTLPRFDTTMILRELPQPRPSHILLGGDYLRKGDPVSPGVPAFLHAAPGQMNRLDFARWLVDPANPLLARVTVNRIWQQYFGRGLVDTENDFGTQGTPPTHPELLDWLATEFIRTGWSQKAIHRLIVTSAVYRQASLNRKDLEEIDPRNLLLARQNRLRLDGELVRDAALVAGGMLSPKIGGPSVFPPQPDGAMSASQIKKTWTPSDGADRYRRGMYTFFWRVTPHPSLIVFDAPNGMVACTRRNRSNTPLQALTLLNETAFHEFAQGLALRLFREEPAGAKERLDRAVRICLNRSPAPAEHERLAQFLSTERDAARSNPAEAARLVPSAAPAEIDRAELAAWVSLSRVLLNLDEFITRE